MDAIPFIVLTSPLTWSWGLDSLRWHRQTCPARHCLPPLPAYERDGVIAGILFIAVL